MMLHVVTCTSKINASLFWMIFLKKHLGTSDFYPFQMGFRRAIHCLWSLPQPVDLGGLKS